MLVVLAPLSAFLMFVFKIKGTTKLERQLKSDPFNQPDGISVALQMKLLYQLNDFVGLSHLLYFCGTTIVQLYNGNFKAYAQKKV